MFSVSNLINNVKQLMCKNNTQSVELSTGFFNGEVEILNKKDIINNPYHSMNYMQLYCYFMDNELHKNREVIDIEYVEVN